MSSEAQVVSSEAQSAASEAPVAAPETKSMSIIVTKGSLDWAYPPFILGTTAAAMGLPVTMFFTFYGLQLLKKDLDLAVSPLGNPGMPMKMPFGPSWFKDINWNIPNLVQAGVPGFETVATSLMKKTIKNKGVASISELRDLCLEADVNMIGCQMTIDLFDMKRTELIDEIDLGGAATYLERAGESDINLFI